MNLVRKLLLKRFFNRNVCMLRSPASFYGSYDTLPCRKIAEAVPQPEWWELDEAKYLRLKGIVPGVKVYPGILEWRDVYGLESNTMDSVGTPGVFIENVLGDDVPVHIVRCKEQNKDYLFMPLYRKLVKESV